jgi:hypothetical protein
LECGGTSPYLTSPSLRIRRILRCFGTNQASFYSLGCPISVLRPFHPRTPVVLRIAYTVTECSEKHLFAESADCESGHPTYSFSFSLKMGRSRRSSHASQAPKLQVSSVEQCGRSSFQGAGAILIDRRTGTNVWVTAKDDYPGRTEALTGRNSPGGTATLAERIIKQLKKDWENASKKAH